MSPPMPMYSSMSGIMSGLPQGGVRPFQPSRGPTSFDNRARFGGMMMGNPFQGMGFGMGGQPQPQPMPRGGMMMGRQPQPQPAFNTNTSGTFQDYMDSFNASPISQIATPLREDTFNEQFGGQPQPPQVSPQPSQVSLQPAVMTPRPGLQPQPYFPMTPTFAPQPQPAPMTEAERNMILTTANPFSSGPNAQNPMMGNTFNRARMEAGMGGIASLAPRQPTMNPFNGMGGLADLFRQQIQQMQRRSSQPSNPSQFMQPLATPQPATQRPSNQPFFSSGLASAAFGGGFGGLMPQG